MPNISWDLVATIVVAMTIFFVLKMIVVGVYESIIEHLRDVERIKAEQRERGIGN
jgi:hypothetical protein